MTQRIIACVLYKKKHIRIEKHAYPPDLVGTDSSYLTNWNSYLPKGNLVGAFRHTDLSAFSYNLLMRKYTYTNNFSLLFNSFKIQYLLDFFIASFFHLCTAQLPCSFLCPICCCLLLKKSPVSSFYLSKCFKNPIFEISIWHQFYTNVQYTCHLPVFLHPFCLF